jgi:hypothetical protein
MVIPHGWILVLYGLPLLFQLATAIIMLRRKLLKQYPFFSTYTVLSVALAGYLFCWTAAFSADQALYFKYYRHYFNIFWALFAVRSLLSYAILYRAFARGCSAYRSLRSWTSVLFGLAIAVSILIAIVGGHGLPRHEIHSVSAIVLAFSQSSQTILAAMFAFVLLFSIVAAVPLWEYGFGIVAGFGIQAVVLLAGVAWRSYAGPGHYILLEYANVIAYLLATATWLGYLVMPMRSALQHASNLESDGNARQVQALKDALKEFLHR